MLEDVGLKQEQIKTCKSIVKDYKQKLDLIIEYEGKVIDQDIRRLSTSKFFSGPEKQTQENLDLLEKIQEQKELADKIS